MDAKRQLGEALSKLNKFESCPDYDKVVTCPRPKIRVE